MGRIKVLVADANRIFRKGLECVVGSQQDLQCVASVDNEKQAIYLTRKLHPDVVLFDIDLATKGETAIAKKIKKSYPYSAIILFSLKRSDHYVLSAIRDGASGYLLKDVDISDLIHIIHIAASGECVFDLDGARDVFSRFDSKGYDHMLSSTKLCERETEILNLVAKGLGNASIAHQLGISERTVATHLSHVFKKLEVGSRTEAVLHSLRKGLLNLHDLG